MAIIFSAPCVSRNKIVDDWRCRISTYCRSGYRSTSERIATISVVTTKSIAYKTCGLSCGRSRDKRQSPMVTEWRLILKLTENRSLPSLEGLRLIASCAIIANHYLEYLHLPHRGLQIAVDLFFIISGI